VFYASIGILLGLISVSGVILVYNGLIISPGEANLDGNPEGPYTYYKDIVVNHLNVQGNLFEFPVLVTITDDSLTKCLSDGSDIVFFNDNGIIQFDHEIDYFDVSSGELVAWVKVPFLSSENNTEFRMYYGSNENTNSENPDGVWSNNYNGVWHFSDYLTSDGQVLDSSSGNHHGVSVNMEASDKVSAPIGNAFVFDGVNERVELGDTPEFETEMGTVTAWVYIDGSGTSWERGVVFSGGSTLSETEYLMCMDHPELGVTFYGHGRIGDDRYNLDGTDVPHDGNEWYHLVWVCDGSNWIAFLDGTKYDNFNVDGEGNWFGDWNGINIFSIGVLYQQENLYSSLDGRIDELTYSANIARSDEWIMTEFTNQKNPNEFYDVSNEYSIVLNTSTQISIPQLTSFSGMITAVFSFKILRILIRKRGLNFDND
jgi:hypothetical protein